VLTLLTTPSSQRLFAHAIAESGVIRHRPLAAARELGMRFATRMGVAATRAGWSTLSEDQILDGQAELYAHPDVEGSADNRAVALVRAMAGGEPGDNLPFVPHVDDTLIPRGAPVMISEGVGSDKPLLLGANAHEFTMVMDGLRDSLSGHDAVSLLTAAGLDAETAGVFRAQFPGFDGGQVLGQLISERMFRMPLLDVVAARTGETAAGTWLYDFRWVSPVMGLALHCAELPFVWDLLNAEGVRDVLGAEPPQELADAMHRAWVRFIDSGDPGWVRAAGSTGPAMVFDSASQVQDVPYLLEAELAGQE
jgi:para-nitrobenzyl esterase